MKEKAVFSPAWDCVLDTVSTTSGSAEMAGTYTGSDSVLIPHLILKQGHRCTVHSCQQNIVQWHDAIECHNAVLTQTF